MRYNPLPWMDDALCAETDPDLFFPEKGKPASPARKICEECPVRLDCLEHAIDRGFFEGIWGGTTGQERKAIVKARLRER